MQQLELILKSEELFAREVALGVIVTRPLKSWLYLIPGMFIIDFLRRQKAIRQYARDYMYPRRHALYCAKALMDGADSDRIKAQSAAHAAQWPKASGKNAAPSQAFLLQVIDLLIDHYRKLLAADGTRYAQLLGNAYPERDQLKSCLDRLNDLEKKRDDALPEASAIDERMQHFKALHDQAAMRRTRLLEDVY